MTWTISLSYLWIISISPFLISAHIIPKNFSNLEIQATYRPAQQPFSASSSSLTLTPLPLVIWHGLGDSYDSDGIKETAKAADEVNTGTYVHVVQLGDTGSADRRATFFGNLNEQIDYVCNQLVRDNILRTAPAINALGFSQGGQFLRAYVERCNAPPVRNLVTLGSQHNGISDFQGCDSAADVLCLSANALLKFGTWSSFVQGWLVPAQYFRDPEDLPSYLESSNFLADVNNERALKNTTYAENIAKLNKLVMYMFADDKTMIPKQSAWFAEYNKTSKVVTPLAERKIYQEDWIGLKKLAEKGGLVFDSLKGEHMQFSVKDLKNVMREYFAPVLIDANGIIHDNPETSKQPEDEL